MAANVMKAPKSIDIAITGACNLRCSYCSHFSGDTDVKDLPLDDWLQFFSELKECGVFDVCLQGGEPFARADLKSVIQGIVDNKMRYSILSNGTLINEMIAKYIANTRRCDYVQVSIDGSTPAVHDSCCGEGSFKDAIRGFDILRKNKVSVAVRVTIHKHNVRDLPNIAKLLLEEFKLPNFGTNSAGYMGLCRQNSDRVQLTAEERTLAMNTLLELLEKYPGRINAMAGPLAEAQHWGKVIQAKENGEEKLPRCGQLTGCGGMWSKMSVRADGVMVPCLMLSHMELGQINKDKLTDVWQNHPELVKLRERHTIPLSDFAYCSDCDYMHYCTGNCPGLSYTYLNDAYQPSPDACLRKFLEEGGSLPDRKYLAKYVKT